MNSNNGCTAIDATAGSGMIDGVAITMTDIDTKIKELEAEVQRLQPAVQRLGLVTMQLDTLRKAKAVLSEGDANASNGNGATPTPITGSRIVPGSIGATAIEVLRQADKPVHIKELLAQVRAKGKPTVSEGTLVSTLCGYVSSGKIKRPAPSTYAL